MQLQLWQQAEQHTPPWVIARSKLSPTYMCTSHTQSGTAHANQCQISSHLELACSRLTQGVITAEVPPVGDASQPHQTLPLSLSLPGYLDTLFRPEGTPARVAAFGCSASCPLVVEARKARGSPKAPFYHGCSTPCVPEGAPTRVAAFGRSASCPPVVEARGLLKAPSCWLQHAVVAAFGRSASCPPVVEARGLLKAPSRWLQHAAVRPGGGPSSRRGLRPLRELPPGC
jgi:hypothetical protein